MFAETATSRSVCLVLRSADLMAPDIDCRVFCSLTAANLELEIVISYTDILTRKVFCGGVFSLKKKSTILLSESKSQYKDLIFSNKRWKSNQNVNTFP